MIFNLKSIIKSIFAVPRRYISQLFALLGIFATLPPPAGEKNWLSINPELSRRFIKTLDVLYYTRGLSSQRYFPKVTRGYSYVFH